MCIWRKRHASKTSWLILGLVALAIVSSAAQNDISEETISEPLDVHAEVTAQPTPANFNPTSGDDSDVEALDHATEASWAYSQALATLTTITAQPPVYTNDPTFTFQNNPATSFISALFPNFQGQGPVGNAIRIAIKLYQHSWLKKLTSIVAMDALRAPNSKKKEDDMRGKAIKVVDLLQHSAELGNADALYLLGQISLFPPNILFDSDPALAFRSFSAHASITGNATSQSILAFFYSTGYKNVVEVDQGMAQLYYTFAAAGGDKGAQMALGYRYWSGIGTLEDCSRAVEWYENASEQAMEKFMSGPPGGRTLPQTATRSSDLAGGAYGPGASVASTGFNLQRPAIKAGIARAVGETWDDVLEYYSFNADRGETDFAYRLGKIFYQGSIYASPGGIASGSEGVGSVPRDFQRARYYFEKIARQVWPRDPSNPLTHQASPHKEEGQGQVGFAAASAAYLGRMFLRGEGVKADPAMAKLWFERGAEYGDRESHNGLGIIWREGLIQGKKDMKKAVAHFNTAASQDLAEAQVNLGKYHFSRNELKLATTHFETAVRHGSPFEAYYYLAKIQAMQTSNPNTPANTAAGSCAIAVSFHKIVAERGVWEDDLLRDAELSWNTDTERGKEMAMLKWWIAAERGFEIAQNNLAFVLDQDKSMLRLTRFSPITPSNDTARLALTQWIRSAGQRNVDALVKVGDYYYHGLGVPEEPERIRREKAARYYQSAADTQMSALAMWNLGWMYENGVGMPQDFHLAKRHYDLALETNSEAYLPVVLSLVKLHIRSIWHTLMGGKGGLSLWPDEEGADATHGNADRELGEGEKHEGPRDDGKVSDSKPRDEQVDGDDAWYMGKAKEEFQKRKKGKDWRKIAQDSEEDPIKYARDHRNSENDRENDLGPEDYFDAALRGGHREEDVADDFGETMLLVALVLLVSVLLYVRTRLMERIRRAAQEEEADVNQRLRVQPGGLFPPREDPAQDDWARVG